jgi:hypothetical protein
MAGIWERARPLTWFIVVVNLIFPLWVLHGMRRDAVLVCAKAFYNNCVAAPQAASSPLVPMLLMWVFADLALAIAWLLSRPRPQLQGPSPLS